MRTCFIFLGTIYFMLNTISLRAQKKPLDHSVYDGWQSLGERKISPNGQWIAYTIEVQEGDGNLVVQRFDSSYQLIFPRGYGLDFTNDSKHLLFKIKAKYADIRSARIKKVKPDEFPKDSLGIINLITLAIEKVPNVLTFKLPKDSSGVYAYHSSKSTDTLVRVLSDSVLTKKDTSKKSIPQIIEQVPDPEQKRKLSPKKKNDESESDIELDADEPGTPGASVPEGTDLVIVDYLHGIKKTYQLVSDYFWSDNGKILLLETTTAKRNTSLKPSVLIWRAAENRIDTLLVGGNDFRGFSIDKNGYQVAFLAERDSAFKSTQKFYKVWYWKNGDPSARILVDRYSKGMNINWVISQDFLPYFSKSGQRLFLGTAPAKPVRDTSLIDIDLVKLDVWHYNDEYLQPYQLRNLDQENKRSYLALVETASGNFRQLADKDMPQLMVSNEGDGHQFLGVSDKLYRKSMQWEGGTRKDIFSVDPNTGKRTLIIKALDGMPMISPNARYIYWYDMEKRHYAVRVGERNLPISTGIKTKLYDEEYDMPSEPTPYGVMRWLENDSLLFVYDRYDIWQLDPQGKKIPMNLTKGEGRKNHISYRWVNTDPAVNYLKQDQVIYLRQFNEKNKFSGFAQMNIGVPGKPESLQMGSVSVGGLVKAKQANSFLYTRERFDSSAAVYCSYDLVSGRRMSTINTQQANYNWMTAELVEWKAYDGKIATGIVYKPEDFDPKRKYPMIAYFYETLSDGLFNYLAPAPTPSRLNIPFFVSRGYIVLAPDIRYQKGYPGKAAYDYIVSGARALVKKGWVDSTKMGIQGQSWGGYQVAHIITRTTLFAAAWAGAPVANMTSAYGGIRWESGMNRQFQYEKSQSRIGATLWEKPQLYIENSPLFHLKAVKTPLVIMANDNDGAVPWYQGIEMFTAMRRLNKPVWMLNYNGEAHNLVERKNRKDIQIREQQFFDWLLKGEKPSTWLKYGVPAIEKGRNWGFETVLD
ncbi:MAG: alpha/beta hydrolase family protein [Chitinophagaceae bacterium]